MRDAERDADVTERLLDGAVIAAAPGNMGVVSVGETLTLFEARWRDVMPRGVFAKIILPIVGYASTQSLPTVITEWGAGHVRDSVRSTLRVAGTYRCVQASWVRVSVTVVGGTPVTWPVYADVESGSRSLVERGSFVLVPAAANVDVDVNRWSESGVIRSAAGTFSFLDLAGAVIGAAVNPGVNVTCDYGVPPEAATIRRAFSGVAYTSSLVQRSVF